jgi:subtilase family serine protease
MAAWAFETTLDVEYAHVMAPGANILVVATPVSETEGMVGFREIAAAENYVIDNGLADVISQSFGATEQTFPSRHSVLELRSALVNAAEHDVTVISAAGDSGATDFQSDQETLYPYRVNSWPASDPLVTSVGGTRLRLDADGDRTAPDNVWQDSYGASGGGLSTLFSRPAFQDGVAGVVGAQRGTPDVALSAAIDGGALVYTSYDPDDVGWGIVGGTSEAAPMFAGVVALAAQLAGHRLGLINPALYSIAARGGPGIVDVTSGDNSFGDVTGYNATSGYDLASGLGTIDAAELVPELAAARTGAG